MIFDNSTLPHSLLNLIIVMTYLNTSVESWLWECKITRINRKIGKIEIEYE